MGQVLRLLPDNESVRLLSALGEANTVLSNWLKQERRVPPLLKSLGKTRRHFLGKLLKVQCDRIRLLLAYSFSYLPVVARSS